MKPIYIYIDDIRTTPKTSYPMITCRDYASAIDAIDYFAFHNTDMMIDFDHDLGTGKTGYDIARYIVETQIPTSLIRYRIHSANPVGRANIHQLLSHYKYKTFIGQ